MRAIVCTLLFFIQISLNYGAFPLIQYKCWIWDSACLTARAQAVTPILTAGIPEIATERLDPMFIDLVHVEDREGLQFDMRNVYIEGLKRATIDKVSVDMNSRIMRLAFHADFSIKSSYTASGYLFSLPIIGHGNFAMKYDDVLIDMIIPFEITKDTQGKNIMNLKEYQYWYDVRGGGQFNLGDLYYKDTVTSERMHAIINQKWKTFSVLYGRFMFDKINDKIFNAIRTYIRSQSLDNIVFY
ncbi:circadian clock-controlled protein daywake-like [Nymphalis io]|uniref:circadian clock-controlled protein daywake-like n=1 Tax=Inachis io TaxID=171585 RepID=UPI00216A1100|nr:circadian clock-controlled protein daywake-like [Nymphalis io]